MKTKSLGLYGVCLVGSMALIGCSAAVEDTRPGQPVKTRQAAFQEILKAFEPMGVMLRTDSYQPELFARLATELVSKRAAPWSLFAADTHYPPTKAKAEVWSQAAQFEQARLAFFSATDALKIAADSQEIESATVAYNKVYDTCKACHEQFKGR